MLIFEILRVAKLGSGVRVGPMAVTAVIIKTIAAITVITVSAKIKMGAAELLLANWT